MISRCAIVLGYQEIHTVFTVMSCQYTPKANIGFAL